MENYSVRSPLFSLSSGFCIFIFQTEVETLAVLSRHSQLWHGCLWCSWETEALPLCRSHIWTWSVALPPWKMSWPYRVLPPWSFVPLAPFVATCVPVRSLKQLQDMRQAHPGLLLPLWGWWTGSVILDHIAACSKAACIPQLFCHVFA